MALAPFLLPTVLLFVVTLEGFRSAVQPTGFRSINCGGEAYNDPITTLNWEEDTFNTYDSDSLLHGIATKVDSQYLPDITHVMQTLRYFPSDKRNKKFCYSFPVSNGSTYLLRASFLYGNYDKHNDPPYFVLLLNYDHWIDVTISSSTIPIVHEHIFLSKGYDLDICLARQFNSTYAPFISALELRPLLKEMYHSSAIDNDHGLMLVQRIDYGANTNATIRFPDDEYDRIWEANTTGPTITSTSNSNTMYYGVDSERPPPKVMATAITTQHPKQNLTFEFEGFGGTGGFRVEMHFQELDQVSNASDLRNFSIAFPNSIDFFPPNPVILPAPQNPSSVFLDKQLEIALPFQIALIPGASAGSNARGPLLNAIELYRWTPQPLSVTGTFQEDVDAIKKIMESFKLSGYGQGDPCVPSGYSWTWIVCNKDEEAKIVEIHLASFNLTGDIPPSINNLEYLQKIDLSNNMLTGEIPNLTRLVNLEYLDLHNNKLEGQLSQSLLLLPKLATLNVEDNDLCGITSSFKTVKNFSYIGNPIECQCLSNPWSYNSTKKVAKRGKYIYPFSSFGSFIIGSILTYVLLYMKEKSRTKHQKIWEGANGSQDLSFTKMFTYKEICNATQHFSILLGKGGFGEVYYGMLSCGKAIAVKTLVEASKHGLKQFSTEVAILSSTRHKNLVCLIGYCMENTHMLIYEYVSKGNLKDLMSSKVHSIDKPLPWTTRLQIAIDASQGLEYLHTGCDPMIIHRDIKSSNILLTDQLQAKVADFGLSRLKVGDNSISHVSTMNVVGTAGYFDPAYVATNQLTDKSDVYSFGIVLFELISGRAPIDYFSGPSHIVNSFGATSHIVDWVTLAIEQGKVQDIVDPMLKHAYKVESLQKVVDMALRCVENDRLKRPKISQVTLSLKEALEIEMGTTQSLLLENMIGRSSPSNVELHTLNKYNESL